MQMPHNYQPRDYQIPLLKAIDSGIRYAVAVWHRRAGKDKTLMNLIAKKMLERVGTYYYMTPTYQQGKKIIWNGMDKTGFKFLDHIPHELRKRTDNTEMLIELVNGSIFQVIGTDRVDSIVGTNPVGTVWSEYSLQDPKVWGYIRPILEENGGWAVFNFTSRGRNHGYDLVEYAKKQDEWFVQILPATDTGVFTKEQLERQKEQYILEDGDDLRFRQEYLCSFDGAVQGSYYGSIIHSIQEKGQITNVAYDPLIPVHTVWDIGVGDATAIWFFQLAGKEIRLIDYLESEGEGLNYYINELQKKGYTYGRHFGPHDIEVREFSTGATRLEIARKLGINFEVLPKLGIEDGIQMARLLLPLCWFDETATDQGLNALRQYHKTYDEKRKVYRSRPEHDWSSHGADAFRYLAVAYNKYLRSQNNPFSTQNKLKYL